MFFKHCAHITNLIFILVNFLCSFYFKPGMSNSFSLGGPVSLAVAFKGPNVTSLTGKE